jgi:hypothetical protein
MSLRAQFHLESVAASEALEDVTARATPVPSVTEHIRALVLLPLFPFPFHHAAKQGTHSPPSIRIRY